MIASKRHDKYHGVAPIVDASGEDGVREQDASALRDLPLLAGMSADNVGELLRGAYLQNFPAHVELIREGDPADFLHVIIDGRVELSAESGGRHTTLDLLSPYATFVVAAVLKDSVYLMSARTLTRSRLLMIPAAAVRAMLGIDPGFTSAVLADLATGYRSLVKALKSQKLRGSIERLANYLLSCHAEQGGNGTLTLPVGRRTLARLLGMTPENLSRAFAALRDHGIDAHGANVQISSVDTLRSIAKPTPLIDDHSI